VLVELPLILGIAWLACIRILQRWPLSTTAAVGMGVVAFSLLMLLEAGLSMLLTGLSLAQHLALYAQLPHQVGLAGQMVFAAFPWIQARRSHARRA
jgi:predicted phage tail protein